MGRSAQHLIGDAERVHDIEGKKRDVRRLEHDATGVEDEIRRRVGLRGAFLTQSRQELIAELHLRDMDELARDLAEALEPATALFGGLVASSGLAGPRPAAPN